MSATPVALVTGATSGFGLETARVLAENGYRVYATYRDAKKLGDLKELSRSLPVQSLYMEVTRPASISKAVASIARREGRIDVLVNNAGFVMAGFLEDLSDQDLKEQFDTNVFGVLRVTRAVVPLMREQRSGKILNIGSISGRVVFPGIGAYAMSKFALRSLTEGLRQELRSFGIEVGEIAPGTFATQVVASARFGEKVLVGSSPYKAYREQTEGMVRKSFERAAPARRVAELILKAVKSSSMKPVAMAGTDAKVMAFLKKRLPDAWFEWSFTRIFSWSRRP